MIFADLSDMDNEDLYYAVGIVSDSIDLIDRSIKVYVFYPKEGMGKVAFPYVSFLFSDGYSEGINSFIALPDIRYAEFVLTDELIRRLKTDTPVKVTISTGPFKRENTPRRDVDFFKSFLSVVSK